MHYHLEAWIENNKNVKKQIEKIMDNDTSFWDWYEVGGRWSGDYTEWSLDKEKLKKFFKEFDKQELGWENNTDKKPAIQRKKSYILFKKYFPEFKGKEEMIPVWRATLDEHIKHGAKRMKIDDISKVEELNLKNMSCFVLVTPSKKKAYDFYFSDESRKFNPQKILDKFLKNKKNKGWLVTVDYHN
jgi:hypothetical protein